MPKTVIPADKITELLTATNSRAELQSLLDGLENDALDKRRTADPKKKAKWNNNLTVAELEAAVKKADQSIQAKFYERVNTEVRANKDLAGYKKLGLDASNFDLENPATDKNIDVPVFGKIGIASFARATVVNDEQLNGIITNALESANELSGGKGITAEGLVKTRIFTQEQADFLITAAKNDGLTQEITEPATEQAVGQTIAPIMPFSAALNTALQGGVKLPQQNLASVTDPNQALIEMIKAQEAARERESADKKAADRQAQLKAAEDEKAAVAKKEEEERNKNSLWGIVGDIMSGNLVGGLIKLFKRMKEKKDELAKEFAELMGTVQEGFANLKSMFGFGPPQAPEPETPRPEAIEPASISTGNLTPPVVGTKPPDKKAAR